MAQRTPKLTVVIDASCIISAMLKQDSVPEKALRHALEHPNRFVISGDVEAEYRDVILRRKFDRFLPLERRQTFLDTVIAASFNVEPTSLVAECADPKDDKYLALAASAMANVIITGDTRHLLPMHPWRGIRILRPAEYLVFAERTSALPIRGGEAL